MAEKVIHICHNCKHCRPQALCAASPMYYVTGITGQDYWVDCFARRNGPTCPDYEEKSDGN